MVSNLIDILRQLLGSPSLDCLYLKRKVRGDSKEVTSIGDIVSYCDSWIGRMFHGKKLFLTLLNCNVGRCKSVRQFPWTKGPTPQCKHLKKNHFVFKIFTEGLCNSKRNKGSDSTA